MISGTRRSGRATPKVVTPAPARAWPNCNRSPAGGRPTQRRCDVKTPRAALDRISARGGGDSLAAPPPGILYLGRPGARGRMNAETGRGPGAGRTRPSAPRGFARTPPPARSKASGRCSQSVRLRRAPRVGETTVPDMHRADAAGGGWGLSGPRSSPSPPRAARAQPCSRGAPPETVSSGPGDSPSPRHPRRPQLQERPPPQLAVARLSEGGG